MTPETSGIWHAIVREAREVSYVLLASFNLFLAYMTYQHGGGFSDWKALFVIIVMVFLSALVMWLGLGDRVRRWTGRDE